MDEEDQAPVQNESDLQIEYEEQPCTVKPFPCCTIKLQKVSLGVALFRIYTNPAFIFGCVALYLRTADSGTKLGCILLGTFYTVQIPINFLLLCGAIWGKFYLVLSWLVLIALCTIGDVVIVGIFFHQATLITLEAFLLLVRCYSIFLPYCYCLELYRQGKQPKESPTPVETNENSDATLLEPGNPENVEKNPTTKKQEPNKMDKTPV